MLPLKNWKINTVYPRSLVHFPLSTRCIMKMDKIPGTRGTKSTIDLPCEAKTKTKPIS